MASVNEDNLKTDGFVPSVWTCEEDVIRDMMLFSEKPAMDMDRSKEYPMPQTLVNYYSQLKQKNSDETRALSDKELQNCDEKDVDDGEQRRKYRPPFNRKAKNSVSRQMTRPSSQSHVRRMQSQPEDLSSTTERLGSVVLSSAIERFDSVVLSPTTDSRRTRGRGWWSEKKRPTEPKLRIVPSGMKTF